MLRFIPMKLFLPSPCFLIPLPPATAAWAGRGAGQGAPRSPGLGPGVWGGSPPQNLKGGLKNKTHGPEGSSVHLCPRPPPKPWDVLQVQTVLNLNSSDNRTGQLLLNCCGAFK